MLNDPDFIFRIGRLHGAAEQAAILLTKQENPDVKTIGENLAAHTDWFFMDDKVKGVK
jgi:hypothetical protein